MAWLASTCSPRRTGQFRCTDDSQRALHHADDTPEGKQTYKDGIGIVVLTIWAEILVTIGAKDRICMRLMNSIEQYYDITLYTWPARNH